MHSELGLRFRKGYFMMSKMYRYKTVRCDTHETAMPDSSMHDRAVQSQIWYCSVLFTVYFSLVDFCGIWY